MLILGIDLETTGLDIGKSEIIEIGACIWDTDRRLPVEIFDKLITPSQEINPQITDLTGITNQDLCSFGVSLVNALTSLNEMAFHCKYVVAHNGNSFDKPMLEAALKSRDLINSEIMAKPWIDTMTDLPFKYDSRKLNYMASDMGFLNPFPHRAIFDVMAMLKVLSRFDFNEIVERALTPKLKIICKTTVPWEDGGKSNEIAKSLGFRWDANAKLWTQLMLASDYEKIKDTEGVRIGVL